MAVAVMATNGMRRENRDRISASLEKDDRKAFLCFSVDVPLNIEEKCEDII